MKNAFFATILTLSFAAPAMAADLCRPDALAAAEDFYGNEPFGTSIRTVVAGSHYVVSVGRGNAEDGEHVYLVAFPEGCDAKAVVSEIND